MSDMESMVKSPPVTEIVMPTFIMDPTEDEVFRRQKVNAIISQVLESELRGKEYDEEESKQWCVAIANLVKAHIRKQLQFPRYKVVVQTVIGQQKHQDVRIASRCLWDNEHDNHASAVIQTPHLWATCIVFGLYAE